MIIILVRLGFTLLLAAFCIRTAAFAGNSPSAIIQADRRAVGEALLRFASAQLVETQSSNGPGSLSATLDLGTNDFRSVYRSGPLVLMQGFDGDPWVERGGVVGIVDLPGLRRDAITSAFLARQGWLRDTYAATMRDGGRHVDGSRAFDVLLLTPQGGSSAEVWFDALTHLLARTVLDSDYGPDRIDYADYRTIDGVRWPMTSSEFEPTGARTVTHVMRLRFGDKLSPGAFARPASRSSGLLERAASVPFRSDAPGYMAHIVIPARLRGQTISLIFDTGGQNSLSIAAAQRLRVRSGGAVNVGGTGSASQAATIATVKAVKIGRAILNDQRFIIFPLSYQLQHPRRGMTVSGITGAELLADFRIGIDYANRRLTLSPLATRAKAPGVTLPFFSDGSHAYVRASIDGAEGLFSLDSGDPGGITIFDSFARRRRLFRTHGIRYLGLGIGGSDTEDAYRARTFEIAGVAMQNPIVHVARSASGDYASRSLAGNLGADVLSRFTLTFDYRARTVTFEPNATAHRPFRADETGMTIFQRRDGEFTIISVARNTPAANAGLVAGDVIVAIDARPVGSMGNKDFDLYRYGRARFTLTVLRNGKAFDVSIRPRALL